MLTFEKNNTRATADERALANRRHDAVQSIMDALRQRVRDLATHLTVHEALQTLVFDFCFI